MNRLLSLFSVFGALLGGVCPGASVAFLIAAAIGAKGERGIAVWISANLLLAVGGSLLGMAAAKWYSGRAVRRNEFAIGIVVGLVAGAIGYGWALRMLAIDPL